MNTAINAPPGTGTGAVAFGVKGGALTRNARWRRIERGLYELPPGKDGKPRYAAEWLFKGRKVRRRFRSVTKAREVLYAQRGRIIDGQYFDRKEEVHKTFEWACDEFTKWGKVNLSTSTSKQDEYLVKRWKVSPFFKGKTLDEIKSADIEAYKTARRAEVGPRQTDYTLSRLRRLFSLAIDTWEVCEKNPVRGRKVKFFNPKARRERYITPDEETKVLDSLDLRLRPLVTFALHTGLRLGEMLTLTWAQVDFKVGNRGQVTVRGDIAKDREDRHVPLTATARAVLDALPRGIKKSTPVFIGFSGRGNFYKLWYKGFTASKLNVDVPPAQRITVHTLRHTYASRLVMAGVDLATIRKLMGHSSIETTMRYAHLARPHIEDAVLVLDEIGKHSVNIPPQASGEPS